GARLVAGVPVDEDCPLLAFPGQGDVAGWPDVVLVVRLTVADRVVDRAEVVRSSIDVGQAGLRPVVPVQLNMDRLEAVVHRAAKFRIATHRQRLASSY